MLLIAYSLLMLFLKFVFLNGLGFRIVNMSLTGLRARRPGAPYQIGSGAHLASYPVCAGSSFAGGEAAGACSSLLTSI
jgi:hypothetical protein